MKKVIAIIALVLLLAGLGMAEQMRPDTDIILTNGDGALIKLFGPVSFWYADGQFPNPVEIVDGVAIIGKAY